MRVFGLVVMCCAACTVDAFAAPATKAKATPVIVRASAAQAAAKEAASHRAMMLLAPGDEYFGPLKQSIIGIRNTIRDLGLRYDVNHDIGKQTVSSAELTERSIRDWEHRYPHDDQVPRAVFLLQRLYTKVLTQPSRDRARATAQWLMVDFRTSPQAKQMKKTLAVEHLAPLLPETTAASGSGQTPYSSSFGAGYPSAFSAASPAPAATTAPH